MFWPFSISWGEFQVNTYTASDQDNPAVACAPHCSNIQVLLLVRRGHLGVDNTLQQIRAVTQLRVAAIGIHLIHLGVAARTVAEEDDRDRARGCPGRRVASELGTNVGDIVGYQVGAILLDLADPSKVLARSWNNILEPRELYELVGQVPNVVFPGGMVVERFDEQGFALPDSPVQVYYGAADTCVGLATTTIGVGVSRMIWRVASSPLTRGMRMSMVITSGRSLAVLSIASCPS